ncbi:maltose alpha-D-glucosyltransferase/alpha-amylase [Arcanobacterium wilhelmae]|uniref:Maltose alpha-D-glucosyltransferase/alpha-amylase n=1 Tax=Arcanobacterium wilhelmae TaxID=1803177 RepID=A0ABT9NAR2_9ACTO|nr:alpha-amylase family glycosyl hydrolase [Arcanobacterium wilhelmae]MDP9800491.1 maltose alpha-D-glucosyltransferase/alpha-amylase [Arcanobacterium wilhelmae]WFN89910.1 alpha-amylase family glycosyl hydrolase [Arcanobacterium wilhelmae]
MAQNYPTPAWMDTAVFYEVYPQSFQDSNGDGIGDLPGLISRLDYIRSLGANALWINPCFDSPFKDAGYDVRDYRKVAPRYGTNDDLIALFDAAHARGMHVILDLVPGHTSEEHEWFTASKRPERGEFSDRYIWTSTWLDNADGLPFIAGEAEREATYILNFFKSQPALNYGFAHPKLPWQKPALGEEARATADAMVEIMRFWLSRGADGFRVDMADSLVKHDDEGKPATIQTWNYMFDQIRPEFPNAAWVSEWGRPAQSMAAGFDADFYLDWRWGGNPNGYNMLLRNTDDSAVRGVDWSYFNADSGADITGFLGEYLPSLAAVQAVGGSFSLITCNHDTLRLAPRLTERERALAFGFLLTMPGAPFIYYGDEIGMRYRRLPTKEGGYSRTGSRTPMQWDSSPQAGFTTSSEPYLPVDPDASAPTVVSEMARPDSLWNQLATLLKLRAETPAFTTTSAFDVVLAERGNTLFAFTRGEDEGRRLVVVNPGREPHDVGAHGTTQVEYAIGSVSLDGDRVVVGPQSFAVLA